MKKIEKRAIMCLLLACVLLTGVGIFCYRYVTQGDDWASYSGNYDVYEDGKLTKGAVYDTNGKLLMKDRELIGIDEEAENAHILEATKKLWGALNHREY